MLSFVVDNSAIAALNNISNPSSTLLRLVSVTKGSMRFGSSYRSKFHVSGGDLLGDHVWKVQQELNDDWEIFCCQVTELS